MKYADEIRQLMKETNKVPTGYDKKIIRTIKRTIKSCAKRGDNKMTFSFLANGKKQYNIEYIVDYFRKEGFETEYELTHRLNERVLGLAKIHEITCKW